ncbi:hypothetical protein D3C72_229710 [compost metagenome]
MVDFNFTVRATDDIGAYTERDFSITVENTLVNQFMATTNLGHILTSVDGYNWVQQNNVYPAIGNNAFGQVINANGFWLVVTGPTTYIRSIDSISWTTHTFPTNFSFALTGTVYIPISKHLTYGDGKIACLLFDTTTLNATAFFSTVDGLTWTKGGNIPHGSGTNNWTSVSNVEYGNGVWLCSRRVTPDFINSVSEIGFKSIDGGATWTPIPQPTGNQSSSGVVRYSFMNGLWYAAGYVNGYLLSNDATNWSYYPYPTTNPSNMMLVNVTYANGKIFCYSESKAIYAAANNGGDWLATWQSVDGLTWSKVTMVMAENSGLYFANQAPTSMSYASYATNSSASSQAFNYITSIFHNGLYVMTARQSVGSGNFNNVLVSPDGVTWTRTNITQSLSIAGVAALRLDDTV